MASSTSDELEKVTGVSEPSRTVRSEWEKYACIRTATAMSSNEGQFWKFAFEKANNENAMLKDRLRQLITEFPPGPAVRKEPSATPSNLAAASMRTTKVSVMNYKPRESSLKRKRFLPEAQVLYRLKIIKVTTSSVKELTDKLKTNPEFDGLVVKSIVEVKTPVESYLNAEIYVSKELAVRLRSSPIIKIGDYTHMVFNASSPPMCTKCWSYEHQRSSCKDRRICKRCSGTECANNKVCRVRCKHCENQGLPYEHPIASHKCKVHERYAGKINEQQPDKKRSRAEAE